LGVVRSDPPGPGGERDGRKTLCQTAEAVGLDGGDFFSLRLASDNWFVRDGFVGVAGERGGDGEILYLNA